MSASVQITLNERELAELKSLNRGMASKAVVLGGRNESTSLHMMYAGFCMALSQLGLDQVIDTSIDEVLASLFKLYKKDGMSVTTFIDIIKNLGYELCFEGGNVTGFSPIQSEE